MTSINAWQRATDYEALAAAHRVEGDMAAAGGPSSVDVRALVEFTKARAAADLGEVTRLEQVTTGIDKLIADLDQDRAADVVVTIGGVQDRLRQILTRREVTE